MKYAKTSAWILGFLLAVLPFAAHAEGLSWRAPQFGPTFADMMKQSANVVFGQVLNINGQRVQISVAKTVKGATAETAWISGFKKLEYGPVEDPRQLLNPEKDYILFLSGALSGNVPANATPISVVVPVDHGKVKVSLLSPVFSEYLREYDFDFFVRYLQNLANHQNGQEVEAAFITQLKETLEREAANPESKEAAVYLFLLRQFGVTYDNDALLFKMLDSKDLSTRVFALHALADVAKSLRKDDGADKGARKTYEERKKLAAAQAKKALPKKADTSLYGRIITRFVDKMRNDPSPLIRTMVANAISYLGDTSSLAELATAFEKGDRRTPEVCEAKPVAIYESPMKASVRAIVEVDDDSTLDVLEREFNKNNVESSRLILEVFRDYNDSGLTLLLLDLMQDRNYLPRQVAILEYFRSINDEQTISGLKALFLSPEAGSEYIRKSIVEVFENFKNTNQTGDFLIQYGLHDKSPVVRQASAKALGSLGDVRLVDEVRKIYKAEPDRLAREFYVDSLSMIKSSAAYQYLQDLLKIETDDRMLKQINFAIKKSKFLSQ